MIVTEREPIRFEIGPDTWVDPASARDPAGDARGLRHLTAPLPVEPQPVAPEQLSLDYLRAVGPGFYGITSTHLVFLEPGENDRGSPPLGHWLRWLPRRDIIFGGHGKTAGEIVVLSIQQTV